MDELLNEYLIQEDNIKHNGYDPTSMNDAAPNKSRINTQQENKQQLEYDEYMSRTKELYYTMSLCDLFRAIWFSASSCYICLTEYTKYIIGWKSRNNAIMDVSKRLAAKNMMYVKIFQAFATNRNIVSPELNQFFSEYTDNVKYTDEEYDINELKELELRSKDFNQQLRILNDYTPIKSGLMSLIFKGVIVNTSNADSSNRGGDETQVVIKYLRKIIRFFRI
jgi:hypothetical protein